MINAMNVLMNRFGGFGFKRTTTVFATTVVATTLMYQAYKAYKAYKAHNVLKAHKTHKDVEPLEPLEPLEPFENKYFKEYDELEDDPTTPIPPLHNHVHETTPQGDVIMAYDSDRSLFCYYCDKRTVQFKYLEPVARKYVITHGCKRLYIDFREELTKAKGKAVAAAATAAAATSKPTPNATSVFAKLKKYSMTTKTNHSNHNAIINNTNKLLKDKGSNANEERVCVLKEHVTRYLYCGRLDDFVDASEHNHANEVHDFNIIKPIDYASYKKMNDA